MSNETPSTGPAVILVRPQLGANIGAAARAMWNFGLTDLRIVAPRDGWPNERAVASASGADFVLENARICETLGEATADLHYAFATTGRAREFIKPIMTPERASEHGRALMGQGQKVGFLFGAERTGLETEEIVGANAILSVPVNPEFKSINLAQCVLLVAYEWRRLGDDTPPEQMDDGKTAPADMGQLNGMLDFLVGELDHSGFFWPEGKRPSMEATLRSAFARQSWTDADLRMMYGAFRALAKRRRSINR